MARNQCTGRNRRISFFLTGVAFCILIAACPHRTEARDLHGRIGLGYNAQFSATSSQNGVSAVSFRYGLAPRLNLQAIAGFYSGSAGSSVVAAKIMPTLLSEPYINFYFLGGVGLVSTGSKSGTEWIGGLGTEFFIPGIESVGFSFETGISIENLTSNSYVVKTFGLSFINAGMHFYF